MTKFETKRFVIDMYVSLISFADVCSLAMTYVKESYRDDAFQYLQACQKRKKVAVLPTEEVIDEIMRAIKRESKLNFYDSAG